MILDDIEKLWRRFRQSPRRVAIGLVLLAGGGLAIVFAKSYVSEWARFLAQPADRARLSVPRPGQPPSHSPIATGAVKQFTNRTPRDLLSLYDGRTILQADKLMEPYKGLWISTQGETSMLIPDTAGVTAVLTSGRDLINARFDKTWNTSLSRVNSGETVKLRGRIADVQNGQQLYLLDCELLD